MRFYRFQIDLGKTQPYKVLPAPDDERFYEELVKFEEKQGAPHVLGSLCEIGLHHIRPLPEPPKEKALAPIPLNFTKF